VGLGGVVIRTDDGGAPVVGVDGLPAPTSPALASFPNPFHAATTVRWSVVAPQRVTLSVIDVTGREVTTLFDGAAAAGEHATSWEGRDAGGAAVRAGVYFVRMQAGGTIETSKVLRVE
jgi:hypothetical protein